MLVLLRAQNVQIYTLMKICQAAQFWYFDPWISNKEQAELNKGALLGIM